MGNSIFKSTQELGSRCSSVKSCFFKLISRLWKPLPFRNSNHRHPKDIISSLSRHRNRSLKFLFLIILHLLSILIYNNSVVLKHFLSFFSILINPPCKIKIRYSFLRLTPCSFSHLRHCLITLSSRLFQNACKYSIHNFSFQP